MKIELPLTSNSSNDDCLSLYYLPTSTEKSVHFLIIGATMTNPKKRARDNRKLHQDLLSGKLIKWTALTNADIFLLFCLLFDV